MLTLLAGCASLAMPVEPPIPAAATDDEVPTAEPSDDRFAGDHWVPVAGWEPDRDRLPPGLAERLPRFRWQWAKATGRTAVVQTPEVATLRASSEATAAVLLVHQDEPVDAAVLQAAVEDATQGESTRAAAAEAWMNALAATATGESDWAAAARLATDLSQPSLVRSELIRGLRVAPQRVPATVDACRVTAPQRLARAVVDACIAYAEISTDPVDYPAAIDTLLRHPDAVVRRRVVRWAALVDHPDAMEWMARQQADIEPEVATAAVVSAAFLSDAEAAKLIEQTHKHPSEAMRAAAVTAAAIRQPGRNVPGRNDAAAIVRRTVARVTGDARTLSALAGDSDRDVQRAVIAASDRLSEPDAIPVLLAATVDGMLETRRAAGERLGEIAGVDEPLLSEADLLATPDERRRIVRSLALQHGWTTTAAPTMPAATIDPDAVADSVAALLADATDPGGWTVLESLTAADLPALEDALRHEPATLTAWPKLWDGILPALGDDFAALAELQSRDPQRRIAAARSLASSSRSRSVSPLVIARLPAALRREQTVAVWRGVAEALAHERGPHVEAIFQAAIASPWADLRELACRFVGRSAEPSLAEMLRPRLTDESEPVRLAAIEAAGRCGQPSLLSSRDEAPGLRDLRSDPSRTVRAAITAAMFRLGDEDAVAELLRRMHETDRSRQLAAIAVLKEAPPPSIAAAVQSLAWTERDDRVRDELLALLEVIDPDAAADVRGRR